MLVKLTLGGNLETAAIEFALFDLAEICPSKLNILFNIG
jgi:hypothetical protein